LVPCVNEVYDPAVPDTRVSSWDGTPLDVNVALPLGDRKNLPLVILINGFVSVKEPLDTSKAAPFLWSGMREWALQGYAVLSYSGRGQGNSCGWLASRIGQPACTHAWQHLDDMRYEARDTQWLASLLSDEGIVDPGKIGVTGVSWGGGQTVMLAALRNRVMLPDGKLVPWMSPRRHLPMAIAVAAPMAAWTDIVSAVVPNGHDLDYTLAPFAKDVDPLGVVKLSVLNGLVGELEAESYMPPPNGDPPVAVTALLADAGWPIFSLKNPTVLAAYKQLTDYHSAYYLPYNQAPAPLLFANGWNDGIFEVTQELQWVNRVLAAHPQAQIAMFLSDQGHPRSQNKAADVARLHQAVLGWFGHYLLGDGAPVHLGVEALTTTCPASAPSGGPYFARSWPDIHPGEVRFDSVPARTILSISGNPIVDAETDPVIGQSMCTPLAANDVPGTATYTFGVGGSGFTMIGSPTVIATLKPTSVPEAPYPYVAAHLFDVAPNGTETLLARQTYRPAGPGRKVFQLYPQGWHFAPGHKIKLELAGQDAPYSRPDLTPGMITVSGLELRLPTLERPNCTTILSPAPAVVPAGEPLAPGIAANPANPCKH
jgi:dienelactone hydrolase